MSRRRSLATPLSRSDPILRFVRLRQRFVRRSQAPRQGRPGHSTRPLFNLIRQALVLDLDGRSDIADCFGWRCPHRHRWHGLHRLLLLAPSHECCERARTYENASSGSKIFPATWLVVPPEQHPHSDVKPESTPDKIASEQMANCIEPRPHEAHESMIARRFFNAVRRL